MHLAQCRSRQMFDSHSIQAIFIAAGLRMTVKETQRAGHATEMVRGLELDQCDALITVGGDGTVFEALQVIISAWAWSSKSWQPCQDVWILTTLPYLTNLLTTTKTHKIANM